MKRILITGKNSYVGTSLEKWLGKYPEKYLIDSICLRGDSWREKDFSEYDVVFHVAGIAHIKETKENASLYYKVNRDLAYEVAQKAKVENVKQFIFLSSMSVYGIESGVIGEGSPLKPRSNYGKSKLEAERLIASLENNFFKIVIIRPPMIYGKGCKGNYTKLAKLALKTPVFPDIDNRRSMIFIYNLCEFVRMVIDESLSGIFHPQNSEYMCSSQLVKMIAEVSGKGIKLIKLFNPLLKTVQTRTVNKVFGDLIYEKRMSESKLKYQIYDNKSSITLTERRS